MVIGWKTGLLVVACLAAAGCTETTNNSQGVSLTQPPSQAVQASTVAEQACLAAVSKQTNNGDVVVLSEQFSQAGTNVTVGVGSQRARWNCIAYSDGSTGEIRSLTDEGSL
ncbi:MAG: hypothetical protein ABJL64_20065 [Rhizobiaceae bacterium]